MAEILVVVREGIEWDENGLDVQSEDDEGVQQRQTEVQILLPFFPVQRVVGVGAWCWDEDDVVALYVVSSGVAELW